MFRTLLSLKDFVSLCVIYAVVAYWTIACCSADVENK